MSQGSVVEIFQPKSVPPKAGKRSRKFRVLVGAVVFIALAVIGVEVWPLRPQGVRQRSQPTAEVAVTVVNPQKAAIAIPVLPGETEAEIRNIAIDRDLGSKLVISPGLSESDQIIISPPPGLVDGSVVSVLGNESEIE
jgi:hypothetical protein